jgi:glycosyltransferase involved in cell wall biosynthesis
MSNLPSLSVFFPAFNDALSIPTLIEKAFDVAGAYTSDFEIIIINDGSVDGTGDVVRSLQERYGPRLRLVNHERNLGYGAALQSGFHAARKELVFYTDGDGQYDVSELPLLLKQMKSDVGLVNGIKMNRSDAWYRKILGSAYKELMRFLFRIRLSDVDCDFRLIRRSLLQDIRLSSTSGTICLELVHKLERTGARTVEVPVHHRPRLHGRSQFFRVGPLFRTFKQLVPLFFRLRRSEPGA